VLAGLDEAFASDRSEKFRNIKQKTHAGGLPWWRPYDAERVWRIKYLVMCRTIPKAVFVLNRTLRFVGSFGKRRLLLNFAMILGNGIIQVLGVASIAPFLAIVATESRNPNFGKIPWIGSWIQSLPYREFVVLIGAATISMLFLANLLMWLTEKMRIHYGAFLIHELRKSLMEVYCRKPFQFYLNTNSSVLLKRVNYDIFQFVNGVFVPSLEIISRLVVLLLLLGLLMAVAPGITLLIASLCSLIYGTTFAILQNTGRRLGDRINKANSAMLKSAQHLFGAIKPIMLHGKMKYFAEKYIVSSGVATASGAKVGTLGNVPRYLIEPVAFGGMVGVIMFHIWRGDSIQNLIPSLSIVALAGYRLLPSFQAVYGQVMNVLANSYTIAEVMGSIQSGGKPVEGIAVPSRAEVTFNKRLKLESLTFYHSGADKPIIERFSLEVLKNSKIGIVGSSGCGKSTLVDLILGLHSAAGGSILIDDTPLQGANLDSWRRKIGYVPQDIYLLDDTIAANIAFGIPASERSGADLRRSAAAAQILDFIEESLPLRFETMVGERGIRLSGGQRQRIGIARALYHGPSVLILDEATSALDTATETEVMDGIYQLSGKLTMLIISHRTSTLDRCDRVIDFTPPAPLAVG
jgi:ABC-type multidrug transport system fused ATPase/permease subunit